MTSMAPHTAAIPLPEEEDERRRRRVFLLLFLLSLGAHVAGGAWLTTIHIEKRPEPVVVTVTTVSKPKPKPVEPPPEPEPPPPEPAPAPKPAPAAAAPPPLAAAPPPQFGISLGGATGGGPGGMAVPVGTPGGQVRKASQVLEAAPKAAADPACTVADTKAKVEGRPPQPAYTADALAQNPVPEGKVRVELSVDATGAVSATKVLEGLGFGLDEAAAESLKQAKFLPATKCGAPVASKFVVSVRFAP